MAIACLRLVTLLPLRPLLSEPLLRFFIARSTNFEAPFEYRRAIVLLPSQTITAAMLYAMGPTFLTAMRETLFRTLHFALASWTVL
jgi:hypothetical protein